jgi:NADH dehydrogenase (ubiquinone) Fe-S protein 6
MMPPSETIRVNTPRVSCEWLEIDEKGYVECGYCDRRFVMIGGVADHKD